MHQNPERSLTGILGAFGKRVNETQNVSGSPGMSAFIKREQIEDETHYSLRPEGQKTIENVPVLMEKLNKPWNELLESGTRIETVDLVPNIKK